MPSSADVSTLASKCPNLSGRASLLSALGAVEMDVISGRMSWSQTSGGIISLKLQLHRCYKEVVAFFRKMYLCKYFSLKPYSFKSSSIMALISSFLLKLRDI